MRSIRFAKARPQRVPGEMNKTEKAYAERLKALVRSGEIQAFLFEGMKLRIAKRTFYTPDFWVMTADGTIEFHEVKGSWKAPHQEDSRVKIKVAAELHFWARFISAESAPKRDGGGWKLTVFE